MSPRIESRPPDALSGNSRPLGHFDEGAAQAAPELVPLADPRLGVGGQLGAINVARQLVLVLEPEADRLQGHLGMALDAPGRLAEPERLVAARAARELDGSGRNVVRVVVPVEGVEALGQA